MKYTNIIATVGPSCADKETLEALMESGVGVFRFNFSHGDHDYHAGTMDIIRDLNKKQAHPRALLLDTKGPDIRTSVVDEPFEIIAGDRLTLTIDQVSYEETGKLYVDYPGIVKDVTPGYVIPVDNGTMNIKVVQVVGNDIECEVIDGGMIKSRRHLNLPGKHLDLDTITEQDWKDIDFGIKQNVDFIALSFVRSGEDVEELRTYLESKGAGHIKIISKVENVEAVEALEGIVDASDGIMVARGDLGAEIPFQQVPRMQKLMVEMCITRHKPVIVATHMLESMIENPMPTRAEVNDVSMAVWQEADCIMMSGETAGGEYPLKSANAMAAIAREVEQDLFNTESAYDVRVDNDKELFAFLASQTALEPEGFGAIVVISKSGTMARNVSSFRPRLPMYVCTDNEPVQRQMNMVWGAEPFVIDFDAKHPDKTVVNAEQAILGVYPDLKGQKYLLVAEFLEGKKFVPTLQVRTLDGQG